jgi:hypothetical protein
VVLDVDLRQPYENPQLPQAKGGMTALRAAAPLALAWARARRHPGRGALVVIGVAVATGSFGAVVGGAEATADQATRRAVERLPAQQRLFTVGWFGVPPQEGYSQIDARATAGLAKLTGARQARSLIFPRLSLGGGSLDLAALDHPGRFLTLTSGRLPGRCTPVRCEVVQVGDTRAPPVVAEAGIRLVVVGTARTRAPLPLPGRASPSGHGAPTPFLLAGSVADLSGLERLAAVYRAYAWTAPIVASQTHVWDVDRQLARETAVESSLLYPGSSFRVSGPDAELLTARDRAQVAEHRLLLVGGGAAALMLAFVILAAGTLRRDLDAEWRRLERRGARLWQRWLLAVAEGAWMTAAGAVAGFAAACLVVLYVAHRAALDGGAVLGHSLLSARGVLLMAAAWVVSLAVLLAAERWSFASTRIGPLTALDALALAAAAAVVLAASRGSADSGSLRTSDPLLPLLPPLVCLAAGIVAARVVAPLARGGERAARRGPPGLRIATLWLARGGAQASITAGFLVVSIGLAVFAATYAATLERGERDQAAFAVPGDFTVREGDSFTSPLDVASPAQYAALAPGAWAAGVVRTSATVPLIGLSQAPLSVLGVPAADLARLAGWRAEYGASDPAALARRLAPDGALRLAGVPIGAGEAALTVHASSAGAPVVLGGVVAIGDGRLARIDFGPVARREGALSAKLPAGTDRRLVSLSVRLTPEAVKSTTHQGAENGAATSLAGTLRIADGRFAGWVAADSGRRGQTLRYTLTGGDSAVLRAPQPTDARAVPFVVSPDVARVAGQRGLVQLNFPGGISLRGRVVAVADRFPTLQQPFAVADASELTVSLAPSQPFLAAPRELWLGGAGTAEPQVAAALARPPYDGLAVSRRRAREADLRGDPLARGTTITLWAAAAVALVLAITGLVLASTGTLRDERGDLYDLEAQGVAPGTLRTQLRLRAAALAMLGVAGGLLLGVALALSVVALVTLAAGGGAPQPPLVLDIGWARAALAAAVAAVAAAAGVLATTAVAFREPAPRRAGGAAP